MVGICWVEGSVITTSAQLGLDSVGVKYVGLAITRPTPISYDVSVANFGVSELKIPI